MIETGAVLVFQVFGLVSHQRKPDHDYVSSNPEHDVPARAEREHRRAGCVAGHLPETVFHGLHRWQH